MLSKNVLNEYILSWGFPDGSSKGPFSFPPNKIQANTLEESPGKGGPLKFRQLQFPEIHLLSMSHSVLNTDDVALD